MEIRRLKDIKNLYKNTSNIDEDTIIYTFDNTYPSDSDKDLMYGITVLNGGTINGEPYMTKGHTHTNGAAEVYYGLEGDGYVQLIDEDNKETLIPLYANSIVYCPQNMFHRVINSSNKEMKFLCVGRADSGHNYNRR